MPGPRALSISWPGPMVTWLCPGVSRCLLHHRLHSHSLSSPGLPVPERGEAGDTHCQHLPCALILIGRKTACHAGGSDSSQQAWEGAGGPEASGGKRLRNLFTERSKTFRQSTGAEEHQHKAEEVTSHPHPAALDTPSPLIDSPENLRDAASTATGLGTVSGHLPRQATQ